MRRHVWLLCVALALGLGGCATASPSGSSNAGAPSGPSDRSTAGAPPTPSAGAGCPSSVILNYADNAKTVCVTRGGSVFVSLGGAPGQDWAPLQVSPAQVLTTVPTSVSLPPDTTFGSYQAAAGGTVEIISSRSACPPPAPGSVACHAVQAFRVTVTVR